MRENQAVLAEQLTQGAQRLRLELSQAQLSCLLAYLDELMRWNRHYNLSSIRKAEDMVSKHLLDSLSIANLLSQSDAANIIDVGTGGGLPGIPLAIVFPQRRFTLLDSAGKKTRFLQQLTYTLALKNVDVVNVRVEEFTPQQPFDIVVSRAFADLAKMVRLCSHLLAYDGEFWAMKGVFPQDELSDLEKKYKVKTYTELNVPLSASENIGERCLVTICADKC